MTYQVDYVNMDKDLQKKLNQAENLIRIQRDSLIVGNTHSEYMYGMLNGLIVVHSIFANLHNPRFQAMPRRRRQTRIRYRKK